MTPIDVLGLIAGCCTSFSLAPQALRVRRTREVSQISLGMLALMLTGTILWLCYGFIRLDISIIWANTVAVAFLAYMLYHKIVDGRATGRW